MGADIPARPFIFGDEPRYAGFDVELFDSIARRLGLRTTWVKTPFDSIFTNLALGRFDAVINGASITEERLKVVNFSNPYFRADQALAKQSDKPYDGIDDLEGKIIGVQSGTTGLAYLRQHGFQVRSYNVFDDALTALNVGQIDAAMSDFPVVAAAVEKKPGLKMFDRVSTGDQYGIAIPRKNPKLLKAVNRELAATIKDGTYARIYEKYFHERPPARFLKGRTGDPFPTHPMG